MKDLGLLKKVGDMSQIAGVRAISFDDGRAKGTSGYAVHNRAGLRFTVTADKCLDIFDLSYKGVNLSFLSKTGLTGNQFFNALGSEFAHYWNAGLLYTCGLSNVGAACADNGTNHPTHGRIGMAPAQNICACANWENADYLISISGDMSESSLFGPSLKLKRKIETGLDSKQIKIYDTVENLEPSDAEYMLLYHFNFGYPLLDEGTRMVKPRSDIKPRTSMSEEAVRNCFDISAPQDNLDEQVFFHGNKPDAEGFAYAGVVNERIGLGAYIKYTYAPLPVLVQWKSMRSHDYALGLEPSNCYVDGRVEARNAGNLKTIPGYGSVSCEVCFGVLDGEDEIAQFVDKMESL